MIKIEKGHNISSEKGFNLLFQEYFPALCSFAFSFIKIRVVDEDIVQDAFVKLWEKRADFHDLISTKVFLYKTVRNDCLNYIKHKKVEEKYLGICGLDSSSEKIILNKIIEEETYRLMHQIIHRLPKRCKNIIELHLRGINNSEIADILNISVNTVKTQKKIAYKIFRDKIKYFILVFKIG